MTQAKKEIPILTCSAGDYLTLQSKTSSYNLSGVRLEPRDIDFEQGLPFRLNNSSDTVTARAIIDQEVEAITDLRIELGLYFKNHYIGTALIPKNK